MKAKTLLARSSTGLRPAARTLTGLVCIGAAAGALLSGIAVPVHAFPVTPSTSVAAAVSGAVKQDVELLTMDKLQRMFQAMMNAGMASQAHPEIGDVIEIDGDASEAKSVAKIAAVPAAVDALKRAGLSPAQFVRLNMTFAASAMAVALVQSNPSAKLPKGVTAENVRFMKQHAADIVALQKRFEAQMEAAGSGQ